MSSRRYALRRGWLRVVMALGDGLGRRCWRPRGPAAPPHTVLCIRLERYGDALLLRPALARARQAWPDARLTWMVLRPYAEFARELGAADAIWPVASWAEAVRAAAWARLRGRRFDLAIEFHGDPRTILLARWLGRRTVGCGLRGGGFWLDLNPEMPAGLPAAERCRRLVETAAGRLLPAPPPTPRLRPTPGAGAVARQLLDEPASGYLIAHPGCAQRSKRWPLRHWQALIQALQDEGWALVLTGGADDAGACAALARGGVRCLAGKSSWQVLTALVSRAAAVVACDTGIVHLAQAVGTPAVALFGPTDPAIWGYSEPRHRSLAHRLECSHCNLGRCPKVAAGAISPCLDAIAPGAVLRELRAVLAIRRAPPAPGGHGLAALPAAAAAASSLGDQAAAWCAPRR